MDLRFFVILEMQRKRLVLSNGQPVSLVVLDAHDHPFQIDVHFGRVER